MIWILLLGIVLGLAIAGALFVWWLSGWRWPG